MHPSLVLLFLHLWGNVGLSLSQNELTCDPPRYRNADIVNYKTIYRYNEQAVYECRDGYRGGFTLTCTEQGWIGRTQCTECQKPEFPNGFIVGPDENKMYYYTCNEGYKLLTKGWWSAAKCNDSVWSELLQCIANTSCSLPDVPNGEVTPKHNSYEQGANVLIICKQGYRAEVNTLTCREGKWPELQQICTPITNSCPPPPKVKNAVVVTSYQKEYLHDSEVTYQCRQSYTTEGNNKITCKNGEWQNVDITCTNVTFVTCEPPPKGLIVKGLPEDHGPILPERLIQISCPPDKTLNGSSGLSCGQDGQWNGPFPTCEDKCRFTGVAESVVFTPRPARGHMFNRGQKLQFGCRMYGHFLHGNAEVVCSGNGQWSDPFPTCGPPSGCGKPPPLADGDTRFTSKYDYNHNDRVEYACKNYYTMRGGPSKICNNGDWTGNITCLRPCTVDKEIMLKHNIAFLYSGEEKLYSPHQTYITFRCTGRTRHVGTVSMRQQCIDGVISLPTCQ